MTSWIDRARSLIREPLVVFVFAGVAVFAIDGALRSDERTIRITPAIRDDAAHALAVQLGRSPTPEETNAAIESWKTGEALYREAVKMGLRDDDPIVRSHVAAKLLQIARERDVLTPPTDAELRDFLERHRSSFTAPASFEFDQVFVSRSHADAEAQAEQLLAKLRGGASPEGLGDWFPRGAHFTHESVDDIGTLFGDQAAKELPGYALGEWHLVRGPQGFHVLRVTRADRGQPDFDQLRPALVLAYDASRRDDAARAYTREVESHYRFVNVP